MTYRDNRHPLQRYEQNLILQNHATRLDQIKNTNGSSLTKRYKRKGEQSNLNRKIVIQKAKASEFKLRQQQENIAKDNELLLRKLVEISSGKRSSIPHNQHGGPRITMSNNKISIYPGR